MTLPPLSTTTYRGVAGTYYATYRDLPASILADLLGEIRDRLAECEDLELEHVDGVLDAAALRLRYAHQAVHGRVEQSADGSLDVVAAPYNEGGERR